MTEVCAWMAEQLTDAEYLLKAKLPKMNRLEKFSYRRARIEKFIQDNPGALLAEIMEGTDLRVDMAKTVIEQMDNVTKRKVYSKARRRKYNGYFLNG